MKANELFSKKVYVKLSYNQQMRLEKFNGVCKVKKYGVELVIDYNENEEIKAYYQGQEIEDLKVTTLY